MKQVLRSPDSPLILHENHNVRVPLSPTVSLFVVALLNSSLNICRMILANTHIKKNLASSVRIKMYIMHLIHVSTWLKIDTFLSVFYAKIHLKYWFDFWRKAKLKCSLDFNREIDKSVEGLHGKVEVQEFWDENSISIFLMIFGIQSEN